MIINNTHRIRRCSQFHPFSLPVVFALRVYLLSFIILFRSQVAGEVRQSDSSVQDLTFLMRGGMVVALIHFCIKWKWTESLKFIRHDNFNWLKTRKIQEKKIVSDILMDEMVKAGLAFIIGLVDRGLPEIKQQQWWIVHEKDAEIWQISYFDNLR